MYYLRLFRAPRTVDLLVVVVLLCSLVAAELRFDPVVLAGAVATVFNAVPVAVVAAIDGCIVVVGGVIIAELPLLFDVVPLFINTVVAAVGFFGVN